MTRREGRATLPAGFPNPPGGGTPVGPSEASPAPPGAPATGPGRTAYGATTGLPSGRGAAGSEPGTDLLPGRGGKAGPQGDGTGRGGPRLRRPGQRDRLDDGAPVALTSAPEPRHNERGGGHRAAPRRRPGLE